MAWWLLFLPIVIQSLAFTCSLFLRQVPILSRGDFMLPWNNEWGALSCFLFLVVILQHTYSKTTQWQSQINDKDIPRSTYCYLLGFLGYNFSLYTVVTVYIATYVCIDMYMYQARMKENLVSPHSSMRFTTLALLLRTLCMCYSYISVWYPPVHHKRHAPATPQR